MAISITKINGNTNGKLDPDCGTSQKVCQTLKSRHHGIIDNFPAESIKYHNAQLHPLSHVEKLTLPRASRLMSFDETRYEHHRLCNGYCARLDRVKTKIMELVFVSSPLSTQH